MKLAVIPAWTGSIRIPRKNFKRLGNMSLMERAIEFAREVDFLPLVSTDDDDIVKLCREIEVKVIKSKHHDGTSKGSRQVWREAFTGYQPEVSILLEPSCPLRTPQDVYDCLECPDPFCATVHLVKTVNGKMPQFNGACYLARNHDIPVAGMDWTFVPTPYRHQINTPEDLKLVRLLI